MADAGASGNGRRLRFSSDQRAAGRRTTTAERGLFRRTRKSQISIIDRSTTIEVFFSPFLPFFVSSDFEMRFSDLGRRTILRSSFAFLDLYSCCSIIVLLREFTGYFDFKRNLCKVDFFFRFFFCSVRIE